MTRRVKGHLCHALVAMAPSGGADVPTQAGDGTSPQRADACTPRHAMRQYSFATAILLPDVRGELNRPFALVQTRRRRATSRILPHPHPARARTHLTHR
jgi:hypothetical protein